MRLTVTRPQLGDPAEERKLSKARGPSFLKIQQGMSSEQH